MTNAASFTAYLDSRRALIDTALEHALPGASTCPPLIAEAMRYSVAAGGKRLRPILTLAAAETVAQVEPPADQLHTTVPGRALPAACAIELIHTYSLIHDDLPAMDDDAMRRGRPTAHVVYGDGMAILAGDGLLTEAFGLLAREPRAVDADAAWRQLRTIGVIAQAAGAVGMVGGQALDLEASGRASPTNPAGHPTRPTATLGANGLRDMHARKTGALIRAAATAGAIMAGGTDEVIAVVDEHAAHLGLAFQITDDILDVEEASDRLGKTAGKDAAAGKPTYPALYGLTRSRELAAESIARAKATLASAGLGGRMDAIADWVIARRT